MTILRIPVPQSTARFSMRVQLSQLEYGIEIAWNERAERWYLQLRDSAGTLICTRPLVANKPILDGLVHASRPPGELIALDGTFSGAPIGFDDWGSRVVLDYLEPADLAELIAEAGA